MAVTGSCEGLLVVGGGLHGRLCSSTFCTSSFQGCERQDCRGGTCKWRRMGAKDVLEQWKRSAILLLQNALRHCMSLYPAASMDAKCHWSLWENQVKAMLNLSVGHIANCYHCCFE